VSKTISTTLYTDAGCPWAYSANPALRVLEWRYGSQLDWRLVMIGLTENADQYVARGYTPVRSALGQTRFRRFGMPFSPHPKARVSATAPGCRAVVAARLLKPGSEWAALRALQFAQFTTLLVLDDEEHVSRVVAAATGLDAADVLAALDSDEVAEAYQREKAETRSAAGTPAESQGKTAQSDGPVRYTAPSVVFERDGTQLIAGGWQTIDAYDVLVANLDPAIERRNPPSDPAELLQAFPAGLTTQEVTALMTDPNDPLDRPATERSLLELVADGRAARIGLGDDALWAAPGGSQEIEAALREARSLTEDALSA
jgi:2-hydroxychromene-2-carboxylate isomerase